MYFLMEGSRNETIIDIICFFVYLLIFFIQKAIKKKFLNLLITKLFIVIN